MAIFVVSICAIWKVSISIDCDTSSTWVVELDGTDGGRTRRTCGARCHLGTRTCNRATWVVPWRKGRSAMDFITGGGTIDSITGECVIDSVIGGGAIDSVTSGGAIDSVTGMGAIDSVTGGGAIDSVISGGASNDIDGWTWVRVDGMIVSGRDEWAGMDTSGGESGDSNDADGWNRGKVDVIGGCEDCTKVDVKGTCRWPAWQPPLPQPPMGGTLTSVINDGGLMDGPEDVDGSCVKCTQWSSPITSKTSIAIQWVSSKSFEIAICDMAVICIRKWNMRHLHII